MKNSILIDLDTDRERQILFSKPPDILLPDTKKEAHEMIVRDIATLSYAIKDLILMTNTKVELVNSVIKTINEVLIKTTSNEFKENIERSSSDEAKENI